MRRAIVIVFALHVIYLIISVPGDPVDPGLPHRLVDAPCTVQNQSLCSWLEVHGLQVTESSRGNTIDL